jgi:hypothetical protein
VVAQAAREELELLGGDLLKSVELQELRGDELA